MTHPWDERYICRSMEWLTFYGFHVGKYTVRPMDPKGYDMIGEWLDVFFLRMAAIEKRRKLLYPRNFNIDIPETKNCSNGLTLLVSIVLVFFSDCKSDGSTISQ